MNFLSLQIFLLSISLLFSILPFLVTSQSPSSELEILLKVKQQWRNQPPMDSWSSTISHCNWPGINCTDGQSVTGISLHSQNIMGEIPPSICDLKNLTFLDLGNNSIPGKFPTFLYNCTKLQSLDLSNNYFVGELPNDINKLSSNLQNLSISVNNFTGDIPISLGHLTGLISLHMDSNKFGTFPAELGNLENLEELVLAYNSFSSMSLPKELGKLKKLKLFWMTSCNLIGEIPKDFANLTSLEHLDLSINKLVGEIPSGLFLIESLTYLYLYRNRLSGSLPASIKSLNLMEFDVSANYLTGPISEDFGKMSNLEIFYLFQNQFNGTIPHSLGKLPSLLKLRVFENRFTGTIPPEMGLHSNLIEIDVSNNGLTGPLPEHLCSGGTIIGVVAFNNYLNGSIPNGLGQCNSLIAVHLYNNSMTGDVPDGLWTSQHMMQLLLHNNHFSGKLPENVAVNLSLIDISNNKFSGKIPRSVSTGWRNLLEFKASNNLIMDSVPLELTSLHILNTLLLDGNQLTGELPSKIVSWVRLNTLNLSHNQLSGSIPSVLGSLPGLNYLDLSDNHFSGQIPFELGQLQFSSLNLSSNHLTGRIPYRLDSDAYNSSYLNTNLCSSTGLLALPKCSIHNPNFSSKYLALIIVLSILVILAIGYFVVFVRSEIRKRMDKENEETWKLTSFHNLDFTEEKICNSLKENNVIGYGGSGKVYKIPINQRGDVVAVKRIGNEKKTDEKSEKEFNAEVQILGTIRHSNIVKLLCCISSEKSRLLVYEYMENQSLDKWIHSNKTRPVSLINGVVHDVVLDWPARLKIAIDAAQGLSYMHNGCSFPIIHRDVKSSNILLDSEFNAKIADFGLARILTKQEGLYTAVAGSFGYMAPEYCSTPKVNEKIDIYSFGVVLLELVTGKEPHIGDEFSSLADWALSYYNKGLPIEDALDQELRQPCYLDEMILVFQIGLMCTSKLPDHRPPMTEVLRLLQQKRSSDNFGRVKEMKDREFSPLLGDEVYISSCKSSKRTVDEEAYNKV
ncbi:unnamed protein product [Amaranthus hypochondriacus]